jgi:hypothetical protein
MLAIRAIALLTYAAALGSGEPLYIHIIGHSHCDPGWLRSFEGYYSTQVGDILSGVTRQLWEDSSRRFVWSEISFFMRWYEVQSDETKQRFHELVQRGQLEFVGGGWSQHDEANPSYDSIIAQLTEGHEYILSLFGVRPRIAWSIDPFGHAAASAAIAAAAGYEAFVINRIDHTVKPALKQRAAMEFIWQPYAPSPALAAAAGRASGPIAWSSYTNASIFTHVLHTHYSAPRSFDFENYEAVTVSSSNAAERARALVSECASRARAYRSSHLLVPWGDDFKFQGTGAQRQFVNMDLVVKAIQANPGAFDG